MSREEHDPRDERTTRPSRRSTQPTDRLPPGESRPGDPVRPDWRSARAAGRTRPTQALPFSRQEFTLWLQFGGWRIIAIVVLVAILAIVALVFLNGPRRPLTGITPTAETSFGGVVELPTVTPTVSAPATAVAGQDGGARFQVFNTGDQGLFLRPNPSTDGPPIKTLPDGTIVTVIGEDASGPDRVWKHVRDPDGAEGWAASDYLQPAQ